MEKWNGSHNPRLLPKYITQEEIHSILEQAKKMKYRDYILLLFLSRTGLRVSEVIKIKKSDIQNNTVFVHQGKGKKDRVIPIDNELGTILGLYSEPLTMNTTLFPITERQVRNICYKYSPVHIKIHPHTLRHSFAVHCLKQGMNLRNLQKILGHNNLTTTQIYLDVTALDIKEDYDKIKWR